MKLLPLFCIALVLTLSACHKCVNCTKTFTKACAQCSDTNNNSTTYCGTSDDADNYSKAHILLGETCTKTTYGDSTTTVQVCKDGGNSAQATLENEGYICK